jgi:DNA-binding NtrC family response regulator
MESAMNPSRRCVLVVDDEAAMCTLLQRVFERGGWSVQTANDADDALEILGQATFDLLVVDKNMPGKSGLDLLKAARERGIATPALLVTGNPTARLAGDLLALQVEGFLRKPFTEVDAALRAANEIAERNERHRHLQRLRDSARGGGDSGE